MNRRRFRSRRLLIGLSTACLLATVAGWIASCFYRAHVLYGASSWHVSAIFDRGSAVILLDTTPTKPEMQRLKIIDMRSHAAIAKRAIELGIDPSSFPNYNHGFFAPWVDNSEYPTQLIVGVPAWIPVLVFGLPVALGYWHKRRSLRGDGCRVCGYNLTGNVTGRCPECGGKVAVS